jgi:hypothetical protein
MEAMVDMEDMEAMVVGKYSKKRNNFVTLKATNFTLI